MRKNFTILLIFLFSTGFFQEGYAQKSMLRYADQQWDLGNYHHSADVYTKAFGRKETYRAAKGAALSFDKLKDYGQSYNWWQNVVKQGDDITDEDVGNYLMAAYSIEKQDEALAFLDKNGRAIDGLDTDRIAMILASFENNSNIELEYFKEINSPTAADFTGAKDRDGNLYFVSDREKVVDSKPMPLIRFDAKNKIYDKNIYNWTGREYLRIYRYGKDGSIQELGFDRNDLLHLSDPAIAVIGEEEYLFFSATKDIPKVKKKKDHTVHPELFYGKLVDGNVTDIMEFPYNNSLEYSVITPFFDPQTDRLYFASDMEGGQGGFDLYFVELIGELGFSSPVNLGEVVNSNGNERDPYVYEDKLYFSSDGHIGLGGFDIFQADIIGGDGFSNLSNMEAPINSLKDDFGYRKFDQREIYLSSNRLGDEGLDDIYKHGKLLRRFMVSVIDCEGELVKDSDLNVLFGEGETLEMNVNGEGVYLAELESDTDYFLTLSKKGHFSIKDNNITTKNNDDELIERNYRLIRNPFDKKVYSDIIYYNLDKSDVRNDAAKRLEILASIMGKYDFLKLKVSSHTDSRASDTYNLALSERRAESVLEDLYEKGVDKDRVSLEWHGEDRLVNDCPDGVDCPEDLHQLNRRSELVLSVSFEEGTLLPEDFLDMDWCNETSLIGKLQKEIEIPIVYFDFDKFDIRLEHKMELERLILLLSSNENISLKLEGHTDIRGSEVYNQGLSERRAEVVMQYLIDRGISKDRLDYEWFGKTKPVYDCVGEPCTPAMHQLNRRTEIKVK
ncbi:OmpA family protein [Belliella marina]|uniref:OmpA family protein n=1 Tax=Belliella marina TaxID=1644146 RepID=A0ABW4VP38_9BACT